MVMTKKEADSFLKAHKEWIGKLFSSSRDLSSYHDKLEEAINTIIDTKKEDNKEIERKFLVINEILSWPLAYDRINQGYLCLDGDMEIRVRLQNIYTKLDITTLGSLTIKFNTKNLVERFEYEYQIPSNEASCLLNNCKYTIVKTRYKIDGFEVDVFRGNNTGLVLAEIELDSTNQKFAKPSWLGEEVTDDVRYRNKNLAIHPYETWK